MDEKLEMVKPFLRCAFYRCFRRSLDIVELRAGEVWLIGQASRLTYAGSGTWQVMLDLPANSPAWETLPCLTMLHRQISTYRGDNSFSAAVLHLLRLQAHIRSHDAFEGALHDCHLDASGIRHGGHLHLPSHA